MIADMSLLEKIEELAKPFLEEGPFEIVDLSIHQHKGEVAIRLLADRRYGGITIEECSQLNRKICQAIEEKNLITERYLVEVSSPGLDRPLKTAKDFSRAVNRDIKVYLSQPFQDKLEWEGFLRGTENEQIVLEGDKGEMRIPLSLINKGIQII